MGCLGKKSGFVHRRDLLHLPCGASCMSWQKTSLSPAGLVLHFAHLSAVFFPSLLSLNTHILGSLALCLRYESQIFFHGFDTLLIYSDFISLEFE